MELIVQKYGGTSVGTPARIRRVARRIAETAQGRRVVAVVSAMGDTTDHLIALARKLHPAPPARELDMLVANGETITAPLVAMTLQSLGLDAISLTGAQAGIRTSRHHSRARIQGITVDRLRQELDGGRICVVAGFQGVTEDNEITTLGRGGSDTTAVALAAALGCRVCEIYTDVDGIYSADPRMVKKARKLEQISYEEMLELASVGARVMHPRAVEIGELYGVRIHVRSSFKKAAGTMILAQEAMEDRKRVRGVAHEERQAKITLVGVPDRPGIAATIFEPLGEAAISVDVIVQSVSETRETDITFTVSEADLEQAVALVKAAANEIKAKDVKAAGGLAKVSIVGTGMQGTPGIAARTFRTLAEAGINIEGISTSEIRITCLVEASDAERAVRALHTAFELDVEKNIA
jgi:aspartate kinase